MDIQKQREAFEAWWEDFHNGRQIACDYVEEDNSYAVGYANAQWVAWQAAKAQKVAVPEGFVVVPKEPTQEIYRTFYDAFNSANAGNTAQCFKVAYKAMIEAQEQVG